MSKRDRFHGRVKDTDQPCQWPNCEAVGDFRAPKRNAHRDDCYWFCLDHVREYNESWDFFKGQTPEQIEAFMNGKNLWHKPTWPMGKGNTGKVNWAAAFDNIYDASGLFTKGASRATVQYHLAKDAHLFNRPLNNSDDKALKTLMVDLPTTPARIKACYKEWVKKLHPDLVGDDENASNQLRAVIEAYTHLSQTFTKKRPEKRVP